MLLFAPVVFLSAFLLFALQPMVAKFLLPSFGGAAAVWSTCLVFFQILLLAGYTYAHLLRTKLSPLTQRWTHLGVLLVSLLFLPPVPSVHPATSGSGTPIWELLRALATSIGVPFFALSATAPLLMEWFRQSHPDKSAHRLYAFSNAGSLLALLAYPVLLEPAFARSTQARLWSGGLVVFLITCALLAWQSKVRSQKLEVRSQKSTTSGSPHSQLSTLNSQLLLWLLLPACASGLLLALTNQLSQDVTPMPLLWVAPMAVYLLTFILCFEGPRSYKRDLFIPCGFLSLLLLACLLDVGYELRFFLQVGGYLLVLFCCCMACHGELYRLRPDSEHLTAYYLAISAGGALGGLFVGVLSPALFKSLLETPLLAAAIASIIAFITWRTQPQRSVPFSPRQVGSFGLGLVLVALVYATWDLRKGSVMFARSFYGAYRVKEGSNLLMGSLADLSEPHLARVLFSGQINHGMQFLEPEAAKIPTTYYCEEGGLGLAFRELPVSAQRQIGAVGLGIGTLAAYGRAGDRIQFYELDPTILGIARTQFTYLKDCSADVRVLLGDARLSLEQQENQGFDLLVLDAFSADAVPVHLLTEQAMRTYMRHLKSSGVMAFHISNTHLDLQPVIAGLAERFGISAVFVPPGSQNSLAGKLSSTWMLLSNNQQFLNRPAVRELMASPANSPRRVLWTDDRSSILPILR